MVDNIEENQLVKKAVTGDKKALEKLLSNNYRIVKGYLLKMTTDYALAEEFTQETMYRAIKNIKEYRPKGKFSTWLITIASNLYRDHLRKSGREMTFKEEFITDNSGQYQSSNYDNQDKLLQLQKILGELPYEKRAVVILKHYYEFRYQEIAEIMNCPVGTVRSRLHYSLNSIRNQLEKGG